VAYRFEDVTSGYEFDMHPEPELLPPTDGGSGDDEASPANEPIPVPQPQPAGENADAATSSRRGYLSQALPPVAEDKNGSIQPAAFEGQAPPRLSRLPSVSSSE